MRARTPGFNGSRLREAREARGLTQAALAEILGVTVQAVSEYENDRSSPQPTVFDKIVAGLNLPATFFFKGRPEVPDSTIYYRSLAAATQKTTSRAEHRAHWAEEIVLYMEKHILFPAVTVPDFFEDRDLADISEDEVEAAALELRARFGLGDGPVPSVVRFLESRGALVLRHLFDSDQIDSFSYWSRILDRPVVILGQDKGSAYRSRLDGVHELGHLVLHRKAEPSQLRVNQTLSRMEKQAFAFGGAFLLPMPAFADDVLVADLDSLLALKRKWNVSIGAMLMRIDHLGLWPETTMQRLWRNFGRRGYRKREPLDDQTAPEEPSIVRDAFEMLARSSRGSLTSMLDQLPFPSTDIEGLIGLGDGFLERLHAERHGLGLRDATPVAPAPQAGGNVIALPLHRRKSR